jgi:hypothetical protein
VTREKHYKKSRRRSRVRHQIYIIYSVSYKFDYRQWWCVLDTTLCDKICQWQSSTVYVAVLWFLSWFYGFCRSSTVYVGVLRFMSRFYGFCRGSTVYVVDMRFLSELNGFFHQYHKPNDIPKLLLKMTLYIITLNPVN